MNRFKLFFLFTFFIGSLTSVSSQNPISWNFEAVSLGENTYKLVASANIQKGWVLYSQYTNDGGPIPTSFAFDSLEGLEIDSAVKELSHLISGFDPLFEIEVKKFKEKAVFEALFKTKGDLASITGSVRFMTCDGLRCLPPKDVEFEVSL